MTDSVWLLEYRYRDEYGDWSEWKLELFSPINLDYPADEIAQFTNDRYERRAVEYVRKEAENQSDE